MSGPLVCRCRVQPPSLEAAGQSHLARLLPFSPLTATERSENPNAIALALRGEEIRVSLAVPAPFGVRGFGGPVVQLI